MNIFTIKSFKIASQKWFSYVYLNINATTAFIENTSEKNT